MKKIEVKARSGNFPVNGVLVTDKEYVALDNTFGVRRLIKDGSLIEKAAKPKKDTKEVS